MDESVPSENGLVAVVVERPCWRCEIVVPESLAICPHCAARLRPAQEASGSSSAPGNARAIGTEASFNLLFNTYALLLVTGIVHALVLGIRIESEANFNRALRNQIFTQIGLVEVIDTFIVGIALWKFRYHFRRESVTRRKRILTWLISIPVLAALLVGNIVYHSLLRDLLRIPLISDELMDRIDLMAIMMICVQPALVEELYCRLFALDCLRGQIGKHAAVWITATMFGFMHVAVLPSVPYLILIGAVLAYLRLASGSIVLPMLVHFLHNLAILAI